MGQLMNVMIEIETLTDISTEVTVSLVYSGDVDRLQVSMLETLQHKFS